jgi:hypothetical protein
MGLRKPCLNISPNCRRHSMAPPQHGRVGAELQAPGDEARHAGRLDQHYLGQTGG